MGENSNIEWTDATWNPWHGCIKVSPGCKFCYMYTQKKAYGQNPALVVRSKTKFRDPVKWAKSGKPPKFCFTCSWSDFFIEQADQWRMEAWEIIYATPQITYQILTKRPERIAQCLPANWGAGWMNVWLGVSCENQETADERIPLLLQTPAAVRWVSAEPLLGPITFEQGWIQHPDTRPHFTWPHRLNWVVVGGESGPDARPMHPDWARSIRDQCQAAGVPFFFKQWGEWCPYGEGGPITHITGADNDRWFVSTKSHAVKDRLVKHPAEITTVVNKSVNITHSRYGVEMFRVGKKAAGRLLDGREWNEYPEVRP